MSQNQPVRKSLPILRRILIWSWSWWFDAVLRQHDHQFVVVFFRLDP